MDQRVYDRSNKEINIEMEHVENKKNKNYVYLDSNYDSIYSSEANKNNGELLNKNCTVSSNYNNSNNTDNNKNIINNSYGNTNIVSSNGNNMANSQTSFESNTIIQNNINDYSHINNYKYGKKGKKTDNKKSDNKKSDNKKSERAKLLNNDNNINNYNFYNMNNNNTSYSDGLINNEEAHYSFENNYNNEIDLEKNSMLNKSDSDIIFSNRRSRRRYKLYIVLKILLAVVIIIALIYAFFNFNNIFTMLNLLIEWVKEQKSWSIVLYLLIFTCTIPLFMSVEIMCVAAGLIFSGVYGKALGIVVAVCSVFLGYVIGMSICFFISRYLLHDFIYKKLMKYPIYLAFNQAINTNGLSFVLLIRLSPILPASLVSYILGVTSVKYKHFALGSITALPSISLFVYIGVLIQNISNINDLEKNKFNFIILLVGLIIGIIALVYISVITRRRLYVMNVMNMSLSMEEGDAE
ncbi:SNARE associated Golgi protein, putative [Hepatocystis sp. ex Piliocolobus tephrosceles]|nr:SNARE associated Golgi protein, putative [Hepatocystis sp. ex Piliocolobus tephrosceles]